MPDVMLRCDQAIFTSVRTPMGEGYRIIAATRGLKPNEKQIITRNSPSHEALCAEIDGAAPDVPLAAAFYPLPTKRLCASVSCFAGAEHTGRGGGRVYTHIVVFDADDFAACGYNAFHVLRAMTALGMCRPQLKPPVVLPEVELGVDAAGHIDAPPPPFDANVRVYVLDALFRGRTLVVNMQGDWLSTAEAILLGLPGPLRRDISFGAGMRFSMSRVNRLELIFDSTNKARARTMGQQVEYCEFDSMEAPEVEGSPWFSFVEQCYQSRDLTRLSHRTSRAYSDSSLAACERVGALFDVMEGISKCDCQALLAAARQSLNVQAEGVEAEIRHELLQLVEERLPERIGSVPLEQACVLWEPLLTLWQQPGDSMAFAEPSLRRVAIRIAEKDPVRAARFVSTIADQIARLPDARAFASVVDEVLARLLVWLRQARPQDREGASPVVECWRRLRPDCQTVQELITACEQQPADSSMP